MVYLACDSCTELSSESGQLHTATSQTLGVSELRRARYRSDSFLGTTISWSSVRIYLFALLISALSGAETMTLNFAEQYRETMKCHSMGNAMYEPGFVSVVQPGSCGYLDKLGNWQPVFNLSDTASLQAAGISVPNKAIREPAKDIGAPEPFRGNMTKSREHQVDLEPPLAAATGVPVTCSVWWDFTSKYGFGAVLACPSGLRKEGYFEGPDWVRWAKDNADALIKHRPQVKDHSLWVITTTYATTEAWINVWGGTSNVASIGFSAGVQGIVNAAPSVAFSKSGSGSSWRTIPAHGTSKEDVVVFFHGVEIKYSRIRGFHEVRGKADVVQDPEDEDTWYEVGFETVGF